MLGQTLCASPGDKGHDAGTALASRTVPAPRDKPRRAMETPAKSHPGYRLLSGGHPGRPELGQGDTGTGSLAPHLHPLWPP